MNSQDQAQIKILVVTGDPTALEAASAILEEAGYAIQAASDGRTCAVSVRNAKPDLILLDAAVAFQGIEGPTGLKADSTPGDVPVMLMIDGFHSPSLVAALESGVEDCICKPLNRLELRWRVERLMRPRASKVQPNDAQRYKEILETAAEVCHKLNQPLQYVMGTVQFLLMDMPADDRLFERLDMVRQKAELMGDITRKLTTLTRHGAQS